MCGTQQSPSLPLDTKPQDARFQAEPPLATYRNRKNEVARLNVGKGPVDARGEYPDLESSEALSAAFRHGAVGRKMIGATGLARQRRRLWD
jgi:hypothetical protein